MDENELAVRIDSDIQELVEEYSYTEQDILNIVTNALENAGLR